jgi:Uncharacterized Zn ribbon-containing protein
VRSLGRRKRRKVKVKRRVIPKTLMRYFQCPVCSSMTLTVDFERSDSAGMKVAVVTCGTCGFHCRFEVSQSVERIDVYNRVADLAYEGVLEEKCRAEGAGVGGELEGEGLEEYSGEEERG